jgi:hypothetical protein
MRVRVVGEEERFVFVRAGKVFMGRGSVRLRGGLARNGDDGEWLRGRGEKMR